MGPLLAPQPLERGQAAACVGAQKQELCTARAACSTAHSRTAEEQGELSPPVQLQNTPAAVHAREAADARNARSRLAQPLDCSLPSSYPQSYRSVLRHSARGSSGAEPVVRAPPPATTPWPITGTPAAPIVREQTHDGTRNAGLRARLPVRGRPAVHWAGEIAVAAAARRSARTSRA